MEQLEDQYLAEFRIQNRRYPGLVTLKGQKSRLELFSQKPINIPSSLTRTIRGITRAGEKITISEAIGGEEGGTTSYYETVRHSISFFPHYIAIGPRHLETDSKIISEITFTTSGAINLFWDHGAFGTARIENIRRFMPPWAKKDRRKINSSHVFYYVNRGPIFSVKTKAVDFEAFNGISYQMPSPAGIKLTNEVRIRLAFKKPLTLGDAVKAIWQFRAFCEVVSHSNHCIQNIAVRHKTAGERESHIRVYSPHQETELGSETDFRDNMISPAFQKKEFETVFYNWVQGEEEHGIARTRAVQGVRKGNSYDIDRLIGAANAFDLLPDSAFNKPKLPISVLTILTAIKMQSSKLKQPYKEQILSNLGRIKGLTLRQKILARYQLLPAALKKLLPAMELLIEHSVRSRNFFVHGSKPKLSVAATRDLTILFTDTLEFLFAMSELTECGWNANRWVKQTGHGRLRQYIQYFPESLEKLKDAMKT
jgi:ApeA N-terminal domain 1